MTDETNEYRGWGPVPDAPDTTDETSTVETDEPTEEQAVTPDEPTEEQEEATEGEAETETDDDPYAEFRHDGKLFGRYDTEIEALKAFKTNDAERGRLAAEVGQLRQVLAQQQAPETTVDLEALSALVGKLPSTVMQEQAFWDYATQELGMEPPTDEDGYVDLERVNPADLLEAVRSMKEFVTEQTEATRVRDVMAQHAQVAEQFEKAFYASHPELETIAPLVETVFNELYLTKQWTPEALDAALTAGVRERITGVAASVLGQRGGTATAARKTPPGATGRGNMMGLSTSSEIQSEEEKWRGWAPKALLNERG